MLLGTVWMINWVTGSHILHQGTLEERGLRDLDRRIEEREAETV